MSKTAKQIKPNYAPVYAAAMYPDLCKIFQKHGYALAVHGSLARDFDLIAIPWVEKPEPRKVVINEMLKHFSGIEQIGKPVGKPPARLAYTFCIGWGSCQFDLSFFPNWG